MSRFPMNAAGRECYRMRRLVRCLGFLFLIVGCRSPLDLESRRTAIDRVLDDWHQAAAVASESGYLTPFADNAVFLGTDASERWSLREFREYVHPYFEAGRGWRYHPFDRHIMFSQDGDLAWFDERLDNAKYGELRGSGVLQWDGERWRLQHYNMSFPIPNELTLQVVHQIREVDARAVD